MTTPAIDPPRSLSDAVLHRPFLDRKPDRAGRSCPGNTAARALYRPSVFWARFDVAPRNLSLLRQVRAPALGLRMSFSRLVSAASDRAAFVDVLARPGHALPAQMAPQA